MVSNIFNPFLNDNYKKEGFILLLRMVDFILGDGVRSGKTEYHGGFNYLDRLDQILKNIDMSIVNANITTGATQSLLYKTYLSWVRTLHFELYPKMGKEQRESTDKLYKEAFKEFAAFEAEAKKHRVVEIKFLEILDEWEKQLRLILEDKGLLMPEKRGALEAAGA